MDNRRVLVAVLLSMIVIIGWQFLFPPPKPPKAPQPAEVEAPASADQATGETAVATRDEVTPKQQEAAAPAEPTETTETEEPPAEAAPVAATEERRVVLEGEGFRAELTNRGAELASLVLPQYGDGEGGKVDLVRDRQGIPYPFGLVGADGAALPVDDKLFHVEETSGPSGQPAAVFTYSGPEGRVTKRFSVEPNGLLGVEVEADLGSPWGIVVGPGLRNPTAREEARKFKYRGAVYLDGEKVKTVAPQKAEKDEVLPGAGLSWVGLEDTYFLSALIPETPVDRVVISPWLVETSPEKGGAPTFAPIPTGGVADDAKDLRREMRVAVFPQGDRFEAHAFLGAKDLSHLERLPWRLQETVRLGWFGFLARFFLVGLQWIYTHVVPNYGWAIVLMTVLIKLVLMPLTHKSYVSMQKMQELAPRIKAIRAKYKGKLRDKKGRPDIEQQRKMNEEISSLYRSEGVNPAGGCLPMILQFPVLIGFYRLLSHAIELRGAPWIFWIQDLSMHDPIYVLPIIMGAVQFLQQRMAPSAGEAMQRRMMMAMPIVFTFLFMGFPSGLVLYWLTNNLLTLIQQSVYQHLKARKTAAAGAA